MRPAYVACRRPLGAALPLADYCARMVEEKLAARVTTYEVVTEEAVRVHSSNVQGFAALPTEVSLC